MECRWSPYNIIYQLILFVTISCTFVLTHILFTSEFVYSNTFIQPYAFFHYRSGSVPWNLTQANSGVSQDDSEEGYKQLRRSLVVRAQMDQTTTGEQKTSLHSTPATEVFWKSC